MGNQKQENNMIRKSQHISIMIINENGLESPVKRNRLYQDQDPAICCLQETHLIQKEIHRLKNQRMKNNTPCDRNPEIAWVATVCADEVDFKPRLIKRQK